MGGGWSGDGMEVEEEVEEEVVVVVSGEWG